MQDTILVIIALVGGVLLGVGVTFFLRKGSKDEKESIEESIGNRLNELLPDVLSKANQELITMANEKLSSETKQSRIDLENKREEINRMVKSMEEYLKTAEKERIDTYATLKTSVDESRKITEQLSVSTEGLKKVLSDNQVRGQFGEQVAEDLLKMAGFVKGVDYEFNKKQEGSQTRPDFAVFLPDGTRINVDSKFPYANLQKMSETEDKGMKQTHMKAFEKDVKEKIKQVTSRDYINPTDKTVDFVILFIPNEMIFSYIYEKLPDVTEEAMASRVILAGPFSFTAILRMVKQSYDNFRVQRNIYTIISDVKAFEKEFGVFSESYYKIGEKISGLQKQYDVVSTTRFRQLEKRIDKVTQEGLKGEEESPMLLDIKEEE
ncbi:DNA recombination protein RmuC [Candidatus Dojkabacteria bacterium]|jgi:DNA recombination protein RmuC|uniref:DNA recombination protein RmuC n=1 Tax=Candidatus Dojkabacteria bacterium TaxID=2099670 RepID=A0A847D045_9BACT|nr:DNA recombination protein RmuC [Candidatus Dojkabacteria bacterium]NLD25588.1 DNA recombination protein RmuC [Candidatus Dojkabacteria bacterium]HOZ44763.1 DNA recombination protein RmuC [Candidatus Dojkabacteria bacterium]HRZ85066.1 DNA recombination protein RmuC [Candidatus Dojkabacteria bacterium]